MYNTLGGPPDKMASSVFARGPRRQMNLVSMAIALFVPWLIFSGVFAVMSFSIHYQAPQIAILIAALCFLVIVMFGSYAVDGLRNKLSHDSSQESGWYIFTTVTGLLAWSFALGAGNINFFRNMQPYYDVINLNFYPSVDPTRMRGQQLMDAGRMTFTPTSQLDLRYSMGFKNLDLYCVAPIAVHDANGTVSRLESYDFWAVGLNCCSGEVPDFHCGEFNNARARSGLRLMRDELRPFFRLAVQQAEAAYNIKAVHPIFVYWLQDPVSEINAYQEDGFKYYMLGMFAHFSFQLFLVITAAIAFSKTGQF